MLPEPMEHDSHVRYGRSDSVGHKFKQSMFNLLINAMLRGRRHIARARVYNAPQGTPPSIFMDKSLSWTQVDAVVEVPCSSTSEILRSIINRKVDRHMLVGLERRCQE